MSPLPLRKDSVINEALEDATNRLKFRLHEAVKVYFAKLNDESDKFKRMGQPNRDDLREYRQVLLGFITEFDQAKSGALLQLDQAIATFELGAADLDAWTTAAKAADKVRPK